VREPSQLPKSFGSRLSAAFSEHGQLCVGIDPHASLLEAWGLEDSAESLLTFGRRVIEAASGRVGIVKPQVAFFELMGAAGFAVLEILSREARDAGLLVIADAKRGDIGTTMDAYLDAWLGKSAPFYADSLTVSPYLGADVYLGKMGEYFERGKGVVSLVATSNPEGESVQLDLAGSQFEALGRINQIAAGPGDRLGPVGAVIGATLNLNRFGLNLENQGSVRTPILAPGFGAQGAELIDIKRLFGSVADTVIASVSRSVLESGASGIANAIDAHKLQLEKGLA
jgi:orotidine-5'-phosphate decarboxylase